MRISDWSSDVCSSDLHADRRGRVSLGAAGPFDAVVGTAFGRFDGDAGGFAQLDALILARPLGKAQGYLQIGLGEVLRLVRRDQRGLQVGLASGIARPARLEPVDRTSVVSGKGVSVRVDLGWCRMIQKKQKNI